MNITIAPQEMLYARKLPVSINDFETMRTEGYVDVDKTPLIHRMVTQGKFYFLSRPRRFGKSVLVTTLKCLYEGRQELFEGLWIAEQGRWDWQAHPVVVLDFIGISNDTSEHLQQGLETSLKRIAEEYAIQLESPLLMSRFSELILALAEQSGQKVEVLIAEYDKPSRLFRRHRRASGRAGLLSSLKRRCHCEESSTKQSRDTGEIASQSLAMTCPFATELNSPASGRGCRLPSFQSGATRLHLLSHKFTLLEIGSSKREAGARTLLLTAAS